MSENICEQLPLIVGICCMENLIKLFRNQIGLLFLLKHKIILFYLWSFVFIRFNTGCYSPSLIVIHSHSLSINVIGCHLLYHSLSLVVTRCTTHCHCCNSLSHSLSFVVTRCTTRLSFYKRSKFTNKSLF